MGDLLALKMIALNFLRPVDFQVECSFPANFVNPASVLTGEKLVPISDQNPDLAKKSMKYSLLTSTSIFPQPLSCSITSALKKK